MRKQFLDPAVHEGSASVEPWLDLEVIAAVQLTSEDPSFPIEAAFAGDREGWRAARSGAQTIWLHFEEAQEISLVALRFEGQESRTQEFTLLASSDNGASYREIVRQQYNFSPGSAETENYNVRILSLTDLKLNIIPDISGGEAKASLKYLRLR